MSLARKAPLLGAALVVLTACAAPSGEASPPKVLTVEQALKTAGKPVDVRGFVLAGPDGVVRLCAGLAGSYPPQCGQPSLRVTGLRLESIPNRETANGVSWAETTVRGTVTDGALTVR